MRQAATTTDVAVKALRSCDGSSSKSKVLQSWRLLLTHSLHAAGMMLLVMHIDSLLAAAAGLEYSIEPTAPVPDASKDDAFVVLRSLLQAVAWLGPQLTAMQQAEGQAGVKAVLLEQQAQIQASLEQILAAGDAGGSSSETVPIPISAVSSSDTAGLLLSLQAAVSSRLAQRLADFAAAVSGCFPAKLCYNAPGCSNLEERSELEAVRGKSCICGGCKVAR
jgi:hypothetical protein